MDFESRAVSPFLEMGAYEALWQASGATLKSISQKFKERTNSIPSDFVPEEKAQELAEFVMQSFKNAAVSRFGVVVHGAGEYPERLRDAKDPVELLYFQGWWDLVASHSVAVVGTRTPTDDGVRRARKLVRALVEDNITVISGLAAGIDRVAHETAIGENGRTIAVLGTPLSHYYPKENAELQRRIADEFLVISQVPLMRYESQSPRINRFFFPARNVTMSALSEATIIVEASERSGTLVQARAALHQGRKLFILDSCFQNPQITWPAGFAKRGAIRVKEYDDIREHLTSETD
jgi:DNA processing protein